MNEYQNRDMANPSPKSLPGIPEQQPSSVCKTDTKSVQQNNPLTSNSTWLSLTQFKAQSTLLDSISRLVNSFICGASVYGLYACVTRRTGLLACVSYLAMALAARKVATAVIGYAVYPAALISFSRSSRADLELTKQRSIKVLEADNFTVKNISLYKSGIRYDALHISHRDTSHNGKWTIHALGNAMFMENHIEELAQENFANKTNTLLVSGPSAGNSGGWPTRYQMGAGFETGLKFLEKEVKATHIIMHGFSLGAGMLGEAILKHDFTEGLKQNIRYLSISDRSFSRLSTIAKAFVGKIIKPLFYVTGTELDGVKAAQKLSRLGIRQIVIQHTSKDATRSDGVIPDQASLAYELQKDPTLTNKIFLESTSIDHCNSLPKSIKKSLEQHIQDFIENK